MNQKSVLKVNILENGYPKDISDTAFLAKLEKLGFEKTDIPNSKNEELNELFREKSHDPSRAHWMCMPIFRDILVFRKQGAISGIAKICFECDLEYFAGTKANTRHFGSLQAHRKLWKLLYEKE